MSQTWQLGQEDAVSATEEQASNFISSELTSFQQPPVATVLDNAARV